MEVNVDIYAHQNEFESRVGLYLIFTKFKSITTNVDGRNKPGKTFRASVAPESANNSQPPSRCGKSIMAFHKTICLKAKEGNLYAVVNIRFPRFNDGLLSFFAPFSFFLFFIYFTYYTNTVHVEDTNHKIAISRYTEIKYAFSLPSDHKKKQSILIFENQTHSCFLLSFGCNDLCGRERKTPLSLLINISFVLSVSRNGSQWRLTKTCTYAEKQWQEGINKRYFRLCEEGFRSPSSMLLTTACWKVRGVTCIVKKSMTTVNYYAQHQVK
jgi:hypothetical protein